MVAKVPPNTCNKDGFNANRTYFGAMVVQSPGAFEGHAYSACTRTRGSAFSQVVRLATRRS
jgi:hypothetical protein